MSNYMIGIASRGRSHLIKQKKGIWEYLTHNTEYEVFVREEEEEDYATALGHCVYEVGNECSIATKRNIIQIQAIASKVEYLVMADDDIKLAKRREDDKTKFAPIDSDGFMEMLETAFKVCGPEYPMVHPRIRFHADQAKYRYEKNCPAIRLVVLHVPTLVQEGITYTGLGQPFMEDRWVQHSLLSRGYRSIALGQWCVDDAGSNKAGGCSETRATGNHNASAKALHEAFPGTVKLKVKNNGAWTEPRVDCIQYFKRYLDKGEEPYVAKSIMEANW